MEISDEELVREVLHRREGGPFAPGVDMHLQCRVAPHREFILRLAIERFGISHLAGAMAQVELLREEAVRLITQKNLARWTLETGIKEGVPSERVAAYRAEYESLQAQVDEIKERCKQIEINARELTEKWSAEQKGVD